MVEAVVHYDFMTSYTFWVKSLKLKGLGIKDKLSMSVNSPFKNVFRVAGCKNYLYVRQHFQDLTRQLDAVLSGHDHICNQKLEILIVFKCFECIFSRAATDDVVAFFAERPQGKCPDRVFVINQQDTGIFNVFRHLCQVVGGGQAEP